MGYHKHKIKKGVIGEISKVLEESFEYMDAEAQDNKIMCLLEMSDIYGALEALVVSWGLEMKDLKIMSDATKSAFLEGERT